MALSQSDSVHPLVQACKVVVAKIMPQAAPGGERAGGADSDDTLSLSLQPDGAASRADTAVGAYSASAACLQQAEESVIIACN